MSRARNIRTGDYIKRNLRFKYFKLCFMYMRNNNDVSIKQLTNVLNVGRNVIIRIFKQATKENMIVASPVKGELFYFYNLTPKGLEWIDDYDEIENRF